MIYTGSKPIKAVYAGNNPAIVGLTYDKSGNLNLFFTAYSEGLQFDGWADEGYLRVQGYTGTSPDLRILDRAYGTLTAYDTYPETTGIFPVKQLRTSFANNGLIQSVYIDANISGANIVGGGTFSNCSNLQSVAVGGDFITADNCFVNCANLSSITFLSNMSSVTYSGIRIFSNCSNLSSITLPNKLTSLSSGAFNNCSNLSSVTFPEELEQVGSSSFAYCTSLTYLEFPASLDTLENNLFWGCPNLTTIRLYSTTPPYIYENTFTYSSLTRIEVPKGSGNTYKTAARWRNYANIIYEFEETP